MRITPLDIRKQEFRKSMRGLDSDEVYAFLTTVAQEYENVLNDNKQLREHIVDLRERLKEFKNMETNLRDTLLTAEKVTAEAKENARHEADLIIKEAEIEAEKASQRVRAEAERLRNEVLELRKQKENYIVRFKTLIDTHRQMILNSESDFANDEIEGENSGWKWEKKAEEGDSHHRMSRERITEEFSHDLQEEQEAVQAAPVEEPGVAMAEPRQEESFEPERPAAEEQMNRPEMKGTGNMEETEAVPEAEPRMEQENQESDSVDQWVDTVAPAEEEQGQAPPAPAERSDEWKDYRVEHGETDWKNYEISQGQNSPEENHPADEVNDALAGLSEEGQMPPEGQAQQAAEKDAGDLQREEEAAPGTAEKEQAEEGEENAWSMEEFRKNLTNITEDN